MAQGGPGVERLRQLLAASSGGSTSALAELGPALQALMNAQ